MRLPIVGLDEFVVTLREFLSHLPERHQHKKVQKVFGTHIAN